jgi:cytidylate kinase
MIIAIDGPAASGKGTIAKRLAKYYGLPHLETGLIYRAVAEAVLDAGHKLDDHASIKAAALALDPTRFDENAPSVMRLGRQPRSSRRFRMCALRCSISSRSSRPHHAAPCLTAATLGQ